MLINNKLLIYFDCSNVIQNINGSMVMQNALILIG